MPRPSRTTRTLLAVLGWLAAAGVAVVVGLVAVSALGRGILDAGPPVTSHREVAAELARPAPPPANNTPSQQQPSAPGQSSPGHSPGASPEAPDTERERVERTPGGTFVARCDPVAGEEQAALVSWSPAQGFRASDVQKGPDDEAEVSFESSDLDVDASVVCRGGQPLTSVEVDD